MAGATPGPARKPVGSFHLGVERTPVMRLARTLDNRSWMPGVYGAIYRANLEIARRTQQRAAQLLTDSIVRPTQRTGRLEEAVADPQAVYADGQRIIVGVAGYLDRVARYWRPVEEGAPGLSKLVFYGWWTRAPRGDRGRVPLEAPAPDERSGRPIVISVNQPPEGGPGRRYWTWQIHNIPDGKFFFSNAWDEVRNGGAVEQIYRDQLSQVRGPNGRPLQLGRLFRGHHGRPMTRSDFGL